jgi:type IV pilus assembly protein PilA
MVPLEIPTMTTFSAYLQSPKTKAILSKKPTDQGFSLIELVVVVAVLAILAAIAIPAFTSINDEARVSGAKATLANLVKECAVKLVGTGAVTYTLPTLNGYTLSATGAAGTCAAANVYTATPNTGIPTGTFVINAANGQKTCTGGNGVGCSATANGVW